MPGALPWPGAAFNQEWWWGATDANGIEVTENPFNEKNLFATIFTALGIDPYTAYDLPNLPTFHRVEEKAPPIREILA